MKNVVKNLCLIEIDYHPEVLHNTCVILKDLPINVSIFTTQKIFEQAEGSKFLGSFNWIVIKKRSLIKRTFIKHLDKLKEADIALFNTLASHFRFFLKLNYRGITILRLHNTNAYLSPWKSFKLRMTPYFIFKDTSHIIRKTLIELDWYFRNKFLKKIDFVVFPDPILEEYAINNGLISREKVCPAIPIATWNPSFGKNHASEGINITIPGTIDIRRKDYKIALEAFKMLTDNLNRKIVLTLLGKPKNRYGYQIISLFNKLQNKFLTVHTFRNKVPMEEYHKFLKETDFFILPIKIDTKYTIYKERYGYTKISGSINDMITAGKPALISADYPLNVHLEAISEKFYNAVDLYNTILDWINNDTYLTLQKKIEQNLSFYSEQNMEDYLLKILNELVNKRTHRGNHTKAGN